MGKIFSLQGCMAVGKTTAARYIQQHMSGVHVSYEENLHVIEIIKERHLDKNSFAGYVEIQKLFIANEIKRFETAQKNVCALMDFGAEEIEFYTLHYPQTMGKAWPVQAALQQELTALQRCMPDKILFLDADKEILQMRKEGDATRSRAFFDYYAAHMLPLKKAWFAKKQNVDFLNVSLLTQEQVGQAVQAWITDNF